jgi:hypothetical protein
MTMAQETIKLVIPFESLLQSVMELGLEDKQRLWKWLDEQIAQAEEDVWEQDPVARAEIQDARMAYAAGDYVTIDEYVAQQHGKD